MKHTHKLKLKQRLPLCVCVCSVVVYLDWFDRVQAHAPDSRSGGGPTRTLTPAGTTFCFTTAHLHLKRQVPSTSDRLNLKEASEAVLHQTPEHVIDRGSAHCWVSVLIG